MNKQKAPPSVRVLTSDPYLEEMMIEGLKAAMAGDDRLSIMRKMLQISLKTRAGVGQ